MTEKHLTVDQAARRLGISRGVLLATIRCGKIPARYGRRGTILIPESGLLPFTDPLSEWEQRSLTSQ